MIHVGGTYTMNAAKAAEAVIGFKPEIAVPMHWGTIVGEKSNALEFKNLAKCMAEILKEEESMQ
jgi:L-ascorbate metabolism protein UlaG (beta-lactamase superfamily)